MTEEETLERLKKSKGVPPLPQVLAQVIRAASRDDADSKELAEIISKDAALTTHLLRVVNSPFYKRTRKIGTVSYAVVQLGIRAVKAIALSAGVHQLFGGEKIVIDRVLFWRHSLETAIACREIARGCNYHPVEEAFVLGLIHDLGLLILESQFPEILKTIWEKVKAGEDLIKTEETHLGTNHVRVAQFILNLWKLPEFMGEAIAQHHSTLSQTEEMPEGRLARILILGNMIADSHTPLMRELDTKTIIKSFDVAESLGFGPISLAELQSKTLDLLMKESSLLEIEIGSETDLLKAANNLIYEQFILAEQMLEENRKMHEQIASDKVKAAALESLRTIAATLAHYINNASAVIVGGAERVQRSIAKGKVIENENTVSNYLDIAVNSVDKITKFLKVLTNMSRFDTTRYTDEASILDIEDRLREQLEAIDKE